MSLRTKSTAPTLDTDDSAPVHTARSSRPQRTADVKSAVARGAARLRARQRADGSWRSEPDMGPLGIAIAVLCEAWLGALTPSDAQKAATSLRALQTKDGGFLLHPSAEISTLGATAVCRAALKACGVADDHRSVRAAEARIAALGGYALVRERMISHAEPAALFCAMVGLVPADVLPPVTPDAAALPWSERMLDGRFHAGIPLGIYAVAAVRERLTGKRWLPKFLQAPTRMLARTRLTAFATQYQNENGSWNCAVFNTVFALIALEGVGLTAEDPIMRRALDWLETRKRRIGNRLEIAIFDGTVWETGFGMLALEACGAKQDDPAITAGASFLLRAQAQREQPRCNQPRAGAPRTGGWAYQPDNDTMPDCDDTGMALAALGASTRTTSDRTTYAAIDRGVAWLRGMQNRSGGFASYVHGLPDKPPGVPAFVSAPPRLDSLRSLVEFVASPPPEFGDPATSDLTARVLWGLGECGLRADDPAVARAIAFLERDACPNGALWGPWNPPYVAATAFVLIGLARVGADLHGALAQRALQWLLSVQNRDGGWGESHRAFTEPALAGKAPSMPPLTGLVLRALAELTRAKAGGCVAKRAGERAAAYLVATEGADGTWPENGYVFTIVPPSQFTWTEFCDSYVLLGLGAWCEVSASVKRR